MDSLSQIIKNLKKEEIRSFKIFMKRYERAEEAKVSHLFDYIRDGLLSEDEIVKKLFPSAKPNMNAYYRLRNRLKTELEKSLLIAHHELDNRISLMDIINLANIFTYKSQYDVSVYYLKKAEKAALENEFYDLLELIYNELINLSHQFEEIDPIEYQEKRKLNAKKNEISIAADHAVAAMWYRLKHSRFSSAGEISSEIQNILKELRIANQIYNLPRVRIRIHGFVRDLLFQSGNFNELENYLVNTYDEFEKANLFTKSTHTSRINLLSWTINVLIINKQWAKSEEFTGILLEELNRYNKLYYDRYIWTYYQSLTTTYIASGKLEEAIVLLKHVTELPGHKSVNFFDYASWVNLALCYYYKKDNSTAIKTLSHVLSKEMFKKLAPEQQFSVSTVEIVLHYESKSFDYVEYKLAEIKRQFRLLLKREDYKQEKEFIRILNMLVTMPNPLRDKKVMEKINTYIDSSTEALVGSTRYIAPGLWLKCKRDNEDYYKNLLELFRA